MAHGELSSQLLQLLADTAEAFIVEPTSELDATIDRTLASIGGLFNVDRAYGFSLNRYSGSVSNTHEWCSPGVDPQIELLLQVPVGAIAWVVGELRAGRAINLESLADLPAGADAERAHLSSQGIQSLLVLPLVRRGRLEGFAGFDRIRGSRRWNDQEVAVLSIVVSGFAQGFERRLFDQQLRQLAYEDPLTCLTNCSWQEPVSAQRGHGHQNQPPPAQEQHRLRARVAGNQHCQDSLGVEPRQFQTKSFDWIHDELVESTA